MEKKFVIELTEQQLQLLTQILDNECDLCDGFVDNDRIKTYDAHGKEVFLTPTEYTASRLDWISENHELWSED